MAPAWFVLRADLRQRWRPMLAMMLLIGLVGGVVLTAAAGAERTDTAYPRMLRWANASQVFILPGEQGLATGGSGRTGFYAAVRRLPQVAAMSSTVLLGMAVLVQHGPPDPNANTAASLDGAAGRTVDRVRVLAGRQYDPADPGSVMIDQRMADLAHLRPGMNDTSPGPKLRTASPAGRWLPPAHNADPSARRKRNAVSAPPSSRFMPIQSQPTACGSSSVSLHLWSSHAVPVTDDDRPSKVKVPATRSCGTSARNVEYRSVSAGFADASPMISCIASCKALSPTSRRS